MATVPPQALSPVGQNVPVERAAGKLAHRVIAPPGRHGQRDALPVDAGGIGCDYWWLSALARFGKDAISLDQVRM